MTYLCSCSHSDPAKSPPSRPEQNTKHFSKSHHISSTPSAQGALRINSEELAKQISVTYLIREHRDLLQDGADRSTPLSSSGEGNNTVGAHVVATSHDGAASMKETKITSSKSSKVAKTLFQRERGYRTESKTGLHICTVCLWSMVNGHNVSIGLF